MKGLKNTPKNSKEKFPSTGIEPLTLHNLVDLDYFT